jgi:hypothetical protein
MRQLLTLIRDWLYAVEWQPLIGPFIATLALLFTVGSFWWLQARQGKLLSYPPHSFAFYLIPTKARLRFPLVLYNTGPKPVVVQDMRLLFPTHPEVTPLPWRTSRSHLMPDAEDGPQLPAVFSVPGRQAQQYFIEFGIDAKEPLPLIDLGASEDLVRVEVLLGHKKQWKQLISFPLRGKLESPTAYIAYSNDAVRRQPS